MDCHAQMGVFPTPPEHETRGHLQVHGYDRRLVQEIDYTTHVI